MIVHVEQREIPADLLGGDYASDAQFRARMQEWVNALWAEKDELIGRLRLEAAARPEEAK